MDKLCDGFKRVSAGFQFRFCGLDDHFLNSRTENDDENRKYMEMRASAHTWLRINLSIP